MTDRVVLVTGAADGLGIALNGTQGHPQAYEDDGGGACGRSASSSWVWRPSPLGPHGVVRGAWKT